MGFGGTTEKCKACNKTVYFIEMITADGISYHKTCFKCSHCNGVLVMSSYSSMDGVLYCKPHFEQLFRESGSFSKKFPPTGDNKKALTKAPSKLSGMFSGTQDKCSRCKKTAYPLEKLTVEGEIYHKSCFRCAHGGCYLTTSNYAALDGFLYCKAHFAQLFKEKGSYSYLTRSASSKKTADVAPDHADVETNKATPESESETAPEPQPQPQPEPKPEPEAVVAQEQS